MKVKCPRGINEGCSSCQLCTIENGIELIDIDVSTADLIAELKTRFPDCMKCANTPYECQHCIWNFNYNDNFKAK